MKKLALNLSELKVESFEITTSSKQTGTIKGNQVNCINTSAIIVASKDCQPTEFENTCGLSCGGSCLYTCAHTCDPNLSKVYCIITDKTETTNTNAF